MFRRMAVTDAESPYFNTKFSNNSWLSETKSLKNTTVSGITDADRNFHLAKSYKRPNGSSLQQDRYARTSIRDSTCDAVPQGSVLGSTRPLKLEPNHDVARLCERSLVGDTDRLDTEPLQLLALCARPPSRFALAL